MFWPWLSVIALLALAAMHFVWRRKLRLAQRAAQAEREALTQSLERATAHAQAQQQALFDSMTEGVLLLDDRGRVQLANRAFASLFGAASDPRSRPVMEAVRSHELAALVDSLGAGNPTAGQELKLPAPNERWLQVNAAAIFNGAGLRQGTVLVFHDLTRLKQLEGARKDFVANVSHELRTPLSHIKGYVETLLDGARNDPDVAVKFLQTIQRNTQRLQLLIEDLLVISELESGRGQLNLQPVSLRHVAEKVLEDYKDRAAAKNIKLRNQTPALSVRADADRLEQFLGNLVDNAIKYGRADGTVTVAARAVDGGQVEGVVQDDGPGIPAEALDRVFERFYRVDKARSREQGGTGLGLAIVKHLVQSHGGKVWATSQPGHGAAFFFTLPQEA